MAVAVQEKQRKSLTRLIDEKNVHRRLLHKIFRHKVEKEKYQLLMFAFDNQGNNMHAVYCMVAFSQLVFVDPLDTFLDQFELDPETHASADR